MTYTLGASVIYSLHAHFCLGPLGHLVVIPNKTLVSPYKMDSNVKRRGASMFGCRDKVAEAKECQMNVF